MLRNPTPDNDFAEQQGRVVEGISNETGTGKQKRRKPCLFMSRRSYRFLWANPAEPRCHLGARTLPNHLWSASGLGEARHVLSTERRRGPR
jgi:hypothetical protein